MIPRQFKTNSEARLRGIVCEQELGEPEYAMHCCFGAIFFTGRGRSRQVAAG